MDLHASTRGAVARILVDGGDGVPDEPGAIAALIAAAGADPAVRAIVVTIAGRPVLAAADAAGAQAFLAAVTATERPLVVRVEGAASGLLLALVAAADVAVAAEDAEFSLPDVREGRVPEAALPLLVAALGAREARRWAVTGDRYRGPEARAAGLVHEAAPRSGLDAVTDRVVVSLLKGDPGAVAATRALAATLAGAEPSARGGPRRARAAA